MEFSRHETDRDKVVRRKYAFPAFPQWVRALCLCACLCPVAASKALAQDTFEFPPEWEAHDAIWMGWAEPADHQAVQLEMISALAQHVHVRLMVRPGVHRAQASAALRDAGISPEAVSLVEHDLYNAWIRDTGPRFLTSGDALAVADPGWNAYGYPAELRTGTSRDPMALARIDNDLARRMELPLVSTTVVAEGGGIDVGSDALLAYRETALQRNPGVSLDTIEREYLRVYGKRIMHWLSRSPLSDRVFSGPKYRNYFGWGANGHIDEFVRFVNDRTIVVARIDEVDARADPLAAVDQEILEENFEELMALTDASGKTYRIVTLPVPGLQHYLWTGPLGETEKAQDAMGAWYRSFDVGDEINWVPAISYLNFVISNGVVLVPAYWHEGLPQREREKDRQARDTLAGLFPGRRIVQINPLALNRSGGGMHCMTQQQPVLRVNSE